MAANHFKISEFCITPDAIPQDVADKILHNFIVPLNPIRDAVGCPVIVSKKAGFRPELYELQHDRTGTSQHCFKGKGAADLTCANITKFADLLLASSPFTRICYYWNNRFFHCDYKLSGPNRYLYLCISPVHNWTPVTPKTFTRYVSGSVMPGITLQPPRNNQ